MNKITRSKGLFLLLAVFGNVCLQAQNKKMELDLPKEYIFNIQKDTVDAEMMLIRYEAINPSTKTAPFEIMVSDLDTLLMPKTMDQWITSVAEMIRIHSPSAQLKTLKEEGNKKLYAIDAGDATNSSTILILMHKTDTRFIMIEAEIPHNEFRLVSLGQWAEIFWKAD